jgi:hypothetical protein
MQGNCLQQIAASSVLKEFTSQYLKQVRILQVFLLAKVTLPAVRVTHLLG